MRRLSKFLGLLAAISLTGAAHADEVVSVKAGFMLLNPSGQVAVTAAGVPGTTLDIDNTLGLDSSKNVIAEVALQLGDFRLGAEYLPLRFDGVGTLTVPITFNGQTFSGAVQSSLDVDVWDISLTYFFINMDDLPSRFQLGLEAAVKVLNIDQSMTAVGLNEQASVTVPIPTIGVRARVALADFLGISGRVGYLGYSGNRFLDVNGQVEFSPLPMVGIYGGYRYVDMKADSSGVFVDARFSGPYVGGLVRF